MAALRKWAGTSMLAIAALASFAATPLYPITSHWEEGVGRIIRRFGLASRFGGSWREKAVRMKKFINRRPLAESNSSQQI